MDRDYTDYTHPKKLYDNLLWSGPDGPGEQGMELIRETLHAPDHSAPPLCRNCGWTTYNQVTSSYGSRVRIMHTRGNIALWAIGNDWLLKDQPNNGSMGNDYQTIKFLHENKARIPLPAEIRRLGKPDDTIQFTLMSRAPGVPLDQVWRTLTADQKSSIATQLADALEELRRFTAPYPQTVAGEALGDHLIGTYHRQPPALHKIGHTVEEWFDSLSDNLRAVLSNHLNTMDRDILDEKIRELKANFPECAPYVLTHADLHPHNIIVQDGRITAIIDWEMAGYYPWWAERWVMSVTAPEGYDEFYESIWAALYPETDGDAFYEQTTKGVWEVFQLWNRGPPHDPNMYSGWLLPAFCKCRPYGGKIWAKDIGYELHPKARNLDETLAARAERELQFK